MALGMPASVMLNVLASGEIALGRSRLTTIRASLLNVAIILGLAVVSITQEVNALAWAFATAFNGLAAWGLWTLIRDRSLEFRGLTVRDVLVAEAGFLRKLLPFLLVPLADQGNVWIERLIASRAAVGSLASLDYARTITDSAVLFVSQPLGLALLSGAAGRDDDARIKTVVRRLLVLSAPACVLLAIFGPDLARAVFARGAFTEAAVQMTGETLGGISLGLWAAMTGWVLLRLLNRAGRNRTAAAILTAAYLSNLVFNFAVFHLPWAEARGNLVLGLGESLRGLVLFGSTVVCLGFARSTIASILWATIPAMAMAAAGLTIDHEISDTWLRLGLAGAACCACMLAIGVVLMPGIRRAISWWGRCVPHALIAFIVRALRRA
jgi:putative peptidoglycan lipid II flippase